MEIAEEPFVTTDESHVNRRNIAEDWDKYRQNEGH